MSCPFLLVWLWYVDPFVISLLFFITLSDIYAICFGISFVTSASDGQVEMLQLNVIVLQELTWNDTMNLIWMTVFCWMRVRFSSFIKMIFQMDFPNPSNIRLRLVLTHPKDFLKDIWKFEWTSRNSASFQRTC